MEPLFALCPFEGRSTPKGHRANKGSICRYDMLDSLLKASPLQAQEGGYSPECVEGVSLLKNPFGPSSAPGSGAKYGVLVVFSPCFWAVLDRRPGRGLLFQQYSMALGGPP